MASAPTRLGRAPAEAVEYVEEVLGLSSKGLAHIMGTDPRTIDRWRKEESYPQREARGRLAELVSLSRIIAEDAPYLFLFERPTLAVVSKRFQNVLPIGKLGLDSARWFTPIGAEKYKDTAEANP